MLKLNLLEFESGDINMGLSWSDRRIEDTYTHLKKTNKPDVSKKGIDRVKKNFRSLRIFRRRTVNKVGQFIKALDLKGMEAGLIRTAVSGSIMFVSCGIALGITDTPKAYGMEGTRRALQFTTNVDSNSSPTISSRNRSACFAGLAKKNPQEEEVARDLPSCFSFARTGAGNWSNSGWVRSGDTFSGAIERDVVRELNKFLDSEVLLAIQEAASSRSDSDYLTKTPPQKMRRIESYVTKDITAKKLNESISRCFSKPLPDGEHPLLFPPRSRLPFYLNRYEMPLEFPITLQNEVIAQTKDKQILLNEIERLDLLQTDTQAALSDILSAFDVLSQNDGYKLEEAKNGDEYAQFKLAKEKAAFNLERLHFYKNLAPKRNIQREAAILARENRRLVAKNEMLEKEKKSQTPSTSKPILSLRITTKKRNPDQEKQPWKTRVIRYGFYGTCGTLIMKPVFEWVDRNYLHLSVSPKPLETRRIREERRVKSGLTQKLRGGHLKASSHLTLISKL